MTPPVKGPRFALGFAFIVGNEVESNVEVGGPGSETGLGPDFNGCHVSVPVSVGLLVDGVSEVIRP